MQKNWIGKDVDLAFFTTCIGDFFKAMDFEAIKGEIPNGYQIFAADSPHFKLEGHVSVSIEGKPEDFVVKVDLCNEQKKHVFRPPTFLVTMFTGGYFFLRKLKSEEAWMKLEKELWRHIENIVLQLTGSSENVTSRSK